MMRDTITVDKEEHHQHPTKCRTSIRCVYVTSITPKLLLTRGLPTNTSSITAMAKGSREASRLLQQRGNEIDTTIKLIPIIVVSINSLSSHCISMSTENMQIQEYQSTLLIGWRLKILLKRETENEIESKICGREELT